MKTHTFTGATSREVLHKVKQALGDDALILSNRACSGGIEVVALAAAGMTAAPEIPAPAAALPEALDRVFAPSPVLPPPQPDTPPAAAIPQPQEARQSVADIDGILSEIQSLKTILRNDIAAFASVETAPAVSGRSTIMRELLQVGFSAQLSRQLAGEAQSPGAETHTMEQVAERLASRLKLAQPDEIINAGGVYALVGPTGVGKTTTVAKLAARAVVRFGASKVALLTTDSYRIGAHDQLRIFGRILSIPVHTIRDADDLAAVLDQLSGRHLVLIDTIGMSQRDSLVAEHAAMLAASGKVKRLLLVSTTANTATLNQVVSAYKNTGIHGCILTKTDEAANLAPAVDAVIRHDLPVHYVTDGQRVPEDLQLPDARTLVLEALRAPADDAGDLFNDELPLLAEAVPTPAPAAAAPAPTRPVPAIPRVPHAAVPMAHTFQAIAPVQARVVHG